MSANVFLAVLDVVFSSRRWIMLVVFLWHCQLTLGVLVVDGDLDVLCYAARIDTELVQSYPRSSDGVS
jgi:hypothetical protein